MGQGDDEELAGTRSIDHAVRITPEHGEAMRSIISREELRTGRDRGQDSLQFGLEPHRRLGTSSEIPVVGGLVFFSRLGVKPDLNHQSLSEPDA
jgi:hypothetical protein